jgi:hypothetical protein
MRHRRAGVGIAILATFASLAIPSSSRAVDGVIEISQARIEAQGGFPLTIADLGSYRLTSNLIVPDADTTAIRVLAPNVTLDLNGFVVSGPTVCSGSPVTGCTPTGTGRGIDGESVSGLHVHDGIVRGMGDAGIVLGFEARVEEVRVVSNGTIGVLVGGSSRILGASVIRNGGAGLDVGADSRVQDSVVVGNHAAGIGLDARTTIIGNAVYANGQPGTMGHSGIVASGSDNTILHNTSVQSGFAGIAASQDNLVTENAVGQNRDFGLRLGVGNTVEGNSVFDNQAGGILGGGGSTLLGNAVFSNQGPGVSLSGSQTGLAENVITENTTGTITPSGSFLQIGGNVCGTNLTCP